MDVQEESTESTPVYLRAVLDTSILYPPYLRDTLLLAAEYELYEPIWSALILDELRHSVGAFGASSARIERTIALMGRQFPRAERLAPRSLIDQMTNAPEDRHVAALAVAVSADVIVTANLKDFRPQGLASYGVVVHAPNPFLVRLHDTDPERCRRVLTDQAARYRMPAMSFEELLDRLAKHAPTFVKRLREQPAPSSGRDN